MLQPEARAKERAEHSISCTAWPWLQGRKGDAHVLSLGSIWARELELRAPL